MLILSACDTKSKIQFRVTSSDTTAKATIMSLEDLRKAYKSMQGQQIETEGIFWFEFENVSICPTRNSLSSEEKRCFWLGFHKDLHFDYSLMGTVSGKRFLIRGTIDTSGTGHLGMYLATINNIYFMQEK
jgi:hypothetical protein